MRLLGQINSPFVRRVAISLELLQLEFELEPLSLFVDFDAFRAINPVAKAPTLVLDSGTVLQESSLILQYVESVLTNGKSLWSAQPDILQWEMHCAGLALAACEKSVQLVYEYRLRPEEKRLQSWVDRVLLQLAGAFGELEKAFSATPDAINEDASQACITTAAAWKFLQMTVPHQMKLSDYSALNTLSERMEATPVFRKYQPEAR